MGTVNKLLAPIAGQPLVRYAVAAACASSARPVIVVVGHEAAALRHVLGASPVTIVDNPGYAHGLATSLRAGVAALPEGAAAAIILLGDAPRVRAPHIDRLIAAFAADPTQPICVPEFAGRRGNPVLWPARHFAELRELDGDAGARPLLVRHAGRIRRVAMDDPGVLFDVDTPEDLRVAARAPDLKPDGDPGGDRDGDA
jgi:molybdenum cofactor cytidylyltransferase